jgi:proton-dependent oligopeptide transporter, POT family
MMSITIGNLFTSTVNLFIMNHDGTSKLEGTEYFWHFTLLMMITATLFIFVARNYSEKTCLQK